jgi:hypothetical protein
MTSPAQRTAHCPGCDDGRQLKRPYVACRDCWLAVPNHLRQALRASLCPPAERTSEVRSTYRVAVGRVRKWLHDHRREVADA